MKHFIILLFSLFFLAACEEKKDVFAENKVLIPFDSLSLLLADIHTIDAAAKQNYIGNNINNSIRYAQYKTILNNHHISKFRFDSTLSFYTQHPAEFMVVYDSSAAILKRQLENYSKVKGLPISAQMGEAPQKTIEEIKKEKHANPFKRKKR